MRIKKFLLQSRDRERETYIWNTVGSMVMAFQSVFLLMILTRVMGLQESGIFTIAYANANLFLNIGKYGMRYFQVSDAREKFSFREFRASRYITSVAMMNVSIIYLFVTAIHNDYSLKKSMIILWMCIFKVPDAIEDVYYGEYQKQGRLDVAAKAMTLRLISTILIYVVGIIVLKDQLKALIICNGYTYFVMICFLRWTYAPFKRKVNLEMKNVIRLLKECFPLFAGAFLSLYIGNAPKYAIDRLLTDELQACYGFIAMPVFVIGLLNGFIFNPTIYQVSQLWDEGHVNMFLKRIGKQLMMVMAITVVCIVGADIMGIPVLSFIYSTDLANYKKELIILLIGGGFLGATGVLNIAITIVREQKMMFIGYVLIAILALSLSDMVVEKYAMLGAAVLYLVLMFGLYVCFLIIFMVAVIKQKQKMTI